MPPKFSIAGKAQKRKKTKRLIRNVGVRVQKKKQLFTSKSLYGTAVEELDPFIFDDTYCVLSQKFGRDHVFRFSASRSLFVFGPMAPTRQLCVYLLTHPWYDIFIISVILANCMALAFDSNETQREEGKIEYHTVDFDLPRPVELTFLALYTVEMILKIIAKGFVLHKFSYMRNLWNVFDFALVGTGLVVEIISAAFESDHLGDFDVDAFRTFRVLRVIKTISIVPGLRLMINSLAHAVVQLLEVMALTSFCLIIFALFALEMFSGKLHSVCVLKKGSDEAKALYGVPDMEDFDQSSPFLHDDYRKWVTNKVNWQTRDFPEEEYTPCSNMSGGRTCDDGYVCLKDLNDNPQDGWINFDHLGYSLLSCFQLLTLDYWERLYDVLISYVGHLSMPFFIIVVFLGSYYLLNLMLAVVTMSYEREAHVDEKEPLSKYRKLTLHRTDSTFSFDDPFRLNPAIMIEYKKRTPSERELLARAIRSDDKEVESTTRADIASTTLQFMGSISFANVGPTNRRNFVATPSDGVPQKEKANVSKKVEKPKRSREEVLAGTNVLAQPSQLIAMTRLAENIMIETSDQNAGVAPQNGTHAAKYNNDKKSEDEISVVSADYIEDTDQYSMSNVTSATDKARTKPPTYNIPLRFLRSLKQHLTVYVNSVYFDSFITICILANTLLLASEHHGQSDTWTEVLENGSYVFMGIFIFECVLKISVLHEEYFYENWNIFDFVVVCLSIMDLLATEGIPGGQAFRTFRLLRIFKLAHSWITMKILLNIIFSTFGALGNVVMILAIFIFIFAILGMQMIGKEYLPHRFGVSDKDDDDFPRWRFENFWFSFMMIFRVLCQEWIEPLWDCLKAQETLLGRTKCFLIFLPVLIIGNFIVLNLFLALLLDSFNTEEIKLQREKVQGASKRTEKIKTVTGMLLNKKSSIMIVPDDEDEEIVESGDPKKARFKALVKKLIVMHRKAAAERAILRAGGTTEYAQERFVKNPLLTTKDNTSLMDHKTTSEGSLGDLQERRKNLTLAPCFHPFCLRCTCRCCILIRRKETPWWIALRKICLRLVTDPFFEWSILVLIVASSITLCFEDIHLENNPDLKFTLFVMNCVFNIIFITEMLLKFVGLGLHKYFTTFWTILDFFIVSVSVIALSIEIETDSWKAVDGKKRKLRSLGSLKALRTLRALRPLRAISRWQGMKVVVNALLAAIPSIFNVLLVCLLFWLVFSIMGVQFFRGKFFRCVYTDTAVRVRHTIVPDKKTCCANNDTMSWINISPNFDNVLEGYLSLFQVATFEGWIELMEAATDIRDERDLQTIRDKSLQSYVYFVVFIVFGSFFTLNLFIGVIIDNFNILKKKYEGNLLEVFLTEGQKKYYTTMKKLGRRKPRAILARPENPFIAIFYDIANSKKFEVTIFVMIFFNMVLIGMQYHGSDEMYVTILSTLNAFFSIIYVIEAFIKIMGHHLRYFTVPWNVFDFCLVVVSLVDFGTTDRLSLPFAPSILRVVRVFRIGRIIRLIRSAKGIRKLLFALVVSLPALFNIGALLALIIFIYAILGMALFKEAVFDTAIDKVWSFQTFPQSAMLLFRLMTAAGWNEVLDALTVEYAEPGCGHWRKLECGLEEEPECVNRYTAIAYMVTFLIITFLIVVNMYIAVILENYDQASKDEEIGIVEDDLDLFYIRWSIYDPKATQFISFDDLSEFLHCLEPPLRVPQPNMITIVYFNLPISKGNKIHCLDILHALVGHVLGRIEDSEEFRKVQDQMESKFRRQFPRRKLLDIISSTRVWKIQHNAARMIQRCWRSYYDRKYASLTKLKRTYSLMSIGDTVSERKFSRENDFFQFQPHRPRKRKQSFLRRLSFGSK